MRGVTFTGAAEPWTNLADAALNTYQGEHTLILEDVVFRDVAAGCRLLAVDHDGPLAVDGLTISQIVAPTGIDVAVDSSMVVLVPASGEVRNVLVTGNVLQGGYLWSSNLPCIDCIFANNRTNGVDGLFSYAVSGFSEPDQNVVYYGNDDPYEPPPIASAADSIFMGNRFAGVFEADAADAVNSLFYDNEFTDYDQPVIGAGDIEGDPMFTDPDNLDFTLQPGSPAIDAGNADPAYDDVDGTRNDMGAFGGPDGDWIPTL